MSWKAIDERMHAGKYCVVVRAVCVDCNQPSTFNIPEREWLSWQNGELIQRAIPSLNDAERELLISGVCGTCFAALFTDPVEQMEDDEL
jgi:hypothetical protein